MPTALPGYPRATRGDEIDRVRPTADRPVGLNTVVLGATVGCLIAGAAMLAVTGAAVVATPVRHMR